MTKSHATCSTDTASPLSGLPHLHAILFDIDGTLTDSDSLHQQVFASILKPHGIEADRHFYTHHISGKQNNELAKELLPHLPYEEAVTLIEMKETRFRQMAKGQVEALKGLYELLRWCRVNGVRTAAVTNAPRDNAEFLLSEMGLCSEWSSTGSIEGPKGGFDLVVLGGECERPKPSPVPYQVAMKALNVEPHNCIVFEDSISGCQAGVAAGCQTVGVLTSQSEEMLMKIGVRHFIRDYTEIEFVKQKLQSNMMN